jgi:ubiquinone/menaquinone biosynthesis C-methylase UbiE
MHSNCKLLFEKYAKPHFKPNSTVLEIGPDGFPSTFQTLAGSVERWDSLDIFDDPRLTFASSDPYAFTIPDNTYDVVMSAQVIEHVRKPWIWMTELGRVVKPGGLVITINPVSWIFHEAPIDCWRIYPDGMKALYEEASLNVLMSKWESLETPEYSRYRPGTSLEHQSKRRQILTKLFGKVGFQVERSYDTITIGQKNE